jgi:predicted PurR-regulated permease PerM
LTTLGGLALFGIAGMVLGPIVGALYMTVWTLWGAAIDEEKNA